MADFTGEDLAGSRFEMVDLTGALFHNVDLTGAVIRGALLVNVDISGEIQDVRINGVDVVPLVEAELDRRYPDRAKMRPADADGYRQAWDILERLWQQTVARARGMAPELLHERVNDEWSFIETLRHLVFATDAWVRRAILGQPSPWDPLDLPHDEMPDEPSVPRDFSARPSLDQVLALRADRMATVRQVIAGLTDATLAGMTEPVTEPGYPPPASFPVRRCLQAILTEEWEHRLYAERDLDLLPRRGPPLEQDRLHGVLKSGITHAFERKRTVAQCVTCGSELHPERAEKYDYCMAPECQEKNLKGLTMVAVGVNKSAEQYLLLDEETRDELARGKYRDQRRGSFGTSMPSAPADGPDRTAAPARPAHRARPPQPRPAQPRPAPVTSTGRGPSRRRNWRCSTTSRGGGRKRSRRSSA